jgi:hypothetical protein
MGVTSGRSVAIEFTGPVEFSQTFEALQVSTGSGQIQQVTLSSGNNTITVPSGAVAVTIIFPEDNTVAVTLKGVNGDTGIALSLTDPTSIGLASVSTFVLSAASTVTVRLIYN